MAITPTVLTAAAGLVEGDGIGINPKLKEIINDGKTLAVADAVERVKNLGRGNLITVLPDGLLKAKETVLAVEKHVNAIFPEGSKEGVQQFLASFGGASSFVTASAEFAASFTEFKDKTFSDIGVNFSSYSDILTNGATSIGAGLQSLADQARTQALATVVEVGNEVLVSTKTGEFVDAATERARELANDASDIFATNAVSNGLKSLGTGLKNFGSLYDFEKLDTLGPKNLIEQLRAQGLTSTNGIDALILGMGYSLDDLHEIPDTQLEIVLQNVSGTDLDKIVKSSGVVLQNTIDTAADLLKIHNILPKEAIDVLNILDQTPNAIKILGDTITNLGVMVDNFSIGTFLENVESSTLKHLGNAHELISGTVVARLEPVIGMGQGLFKNPDMKDMMASVAGIGVNETLHDVVHFAKSLNDTNQGTSFVSAVDRLEAAIMALANGDPEDPSYAALVQEVMDAEAAVAGTATNITSFVQSNFSLSKIAETASASVDGALQQITHEAQSLTKSGLKIIDGVMHTVSAIGGEVALAASSSYASILTFATKLHNYGVDTLKVGFNDILSGIAQDDLFGDAIKGSLIEGRNMVRSRLIGKGEVAATEQIDAIRVKLLEDLKLEEQKIEGLLLSDGSATGSDKLMSLKEIDDIEGKIKGIRTQLRL